MYSYLYWQWLRRDLLSRYRGSAMGLWWSLIQPASQMLVFTLVFHGFFGMRWPGSADTDQSAFEYGANVFLGLAVFTYLAEVLVRSPHSVLAQPNLITRVRFPLGLLPLVTVGAALIHVGVATALVLPWVVDRANWLALPLLPLWLAPLALYGVGLAWGLGALNLYIRDIGHAMPPVSNLVLFLSPVFYPASTIPASLGWMIAINPVAWGTEVLRDLLLRGLWPDIGLWGGHMVASAVLALLGQRLFVRLQPGFADVI